MNKGRSIRVAVALALGVALSTGGAGASPAYPEVLVDELDPPCSPPCTVCHESPSGGFGTAVKPFARTLRSEGLQAGDSDSLRDAIAQTRASGDQAANDALDALAEGSDPNGGEQALSSVEYGCSVSARRSLDASFLVLVATALLLGLGVRRRRR